MFWFINIETGELVSHEQMEEQLKAAREAVEIHRNEPLSPYFIRDLENNQATCPMGQILLKCNIPKRQE